MPMSKKVARYPAPLFDLLKITKEQLPIVINCETKAKAMQKRLQIYGFTEALRNERHPGCILLDALLLKVDGPMLIIEDRDTYDSAFAQGLTAAVNAPVTPTSSERTQTAPAPASGSAHDSAIARYLGKDSDGK